MLGRRKLTDSELAAFQYCRSIESAQIAKEFDLVISELDLSFESQRTAYAKIGLVMEKAWVPKLSFQSVELEDLLEVLLGKRRKD